jgi:uncharacterized membrane protein
MATLVVIGYADQGVAENARKAVEELEDELIIRADQIASIARDVEGRYHAHICHGGGSPGGGADWGGFWGALFGLLFLIPIAGLAAGGGCDALRGLLGEKTIGKGFRDQVRKQVKPGTSAVFMVIEDGPHEALGALERYGGMVIETSLSDAEVERLREALGAPPSGDTGPTAPQTGRRSG